MESWMTDETFWETNSVSNAEFVQEKESGMNFNPCFQMKSFLL